MIGIILYSIDYKTLLNKNRQGGSVRMRFRHPGENTDTFKPKMRKNWSRNPPFLFAKLFKYD